MLLLKVLALFGVALVAGGWMMGSFLVVPAQKELSASEYTAVEQANTKFGVRYYPMVMAMTIILLVTLLILTWRSGQSVVLIGASLAFVIAGLVFTRVIMVPLNGRIDTWSVQSPPGNWQEERDAWHTNHRIRTVLAVTAFFLLSTAIAQAAPTKNTKNASTKSSGQAALRARS